MSGLVGGRRTDAWVVRAYQEAQHSDILQTFNEYVGKQKMIVWPGGSPDFMRAVAAASAEREPALAGAIPRPQDKKSHDHP